MSAVTIVFLPLSAKLVFPIWGLIGLVVYFAYSRRRSNMRPQPGVEVTRA